MTLLVNAVCTDPIILTPIFEFLTTELFTRVFCEFLIRIALVKLFTVMFSTTVFFASSILIASALAELIISQFLITTSDAPLINTP